MVRAGRGLAAATTCAVALSSAGATRTAPKAEGAAPQALAVDPSAFPLRRAVAALARPGMPLPGDPCRLSSSQDKRPCFPASVERRALTPEQKLARFFEDFDALHGPTFASAPTVKELWRLPAIRGIPLDFVPLVKLLLEARRKRQPPRFFLYCAREGGRAWPVLREGRLPAEIAYARPGVTYEELGGFPDRKTAEAAYERLEDALAAGGDVKP
jgi:hypothetical protein